MGMVVSIAVEGIAVDRSIAVEAGIVVEVGMSRGKVVEKIGFAVEAGMDFVCMYTFVIIIEN